MSEEEAQSREAIQEMDRGIESMDFLQLSHSPRLRSINLHSNRIRVIEGVKTLQHLQVLNLSSNHIEKIEGLEQCASLRVLNLSCNRIRKLGNGLQNLRVLEELNLSYNLVDTLSDAVFPTDGKLHLLDLRGNRVSSLDDLFLLSPLARSVHVLLFQKEGQFANPVCFEPRYEETIRSILPNITHLDIFPPLAAADWSERDSIHRLLEWEDDRDEFADTDEFHMDSSGSIPSSLMDTPTSSISSSSRGATRYHSSKIKSRRKPVSPKKQGVKRDIDSHEEESDSHPPFETPRIDAILSHRRHHDESSQQDATPKGNLRKRHKGRHSSLVEKEKEVEDMRVDKEKDGGGIDLMTMEQFKSKSSPKKKPKRKPNSPLKTKRIEVKPQTPTVSSMDSDAISESHVPVPEKERDQSGESMALDPSVHNSCGDREQEAAEFVVVHGKRKDLQAQWDKQDSILKGLDRERSLRERVGMLMDALEKAERRAEQAEYSVIASTRRFEGIIEELKEQNSKKSSQISAYKAQKKAMEGKLKEIREFLMDREDILQSQKAKISNLERRIEERDLSIKEAKEREEEDEKTRKLLKESQSASDERATRFERLTETLQSEIDDWKVRFMELGKDRDNLRDLYDQLRLDYEEARKRDSQKNEELEQKASAAQSALEKERESKEHDVALIRMELERAFQSQREEEAERTQQRMGILKEQYEAKVTRDAKRLAELQKEYEIISKSAAELKQVLRVTVQKEIRSTALATELTEIVKEQKGKISRLTQSYREASEMKERLLKEVSVLRKDQASKAHALGRLQAELALCEQKSDHYGKTHKRIEAEYGKNYSEVCVENGRLKGEMARLEKGLEAMRDLEDKVRRMEDEKQRLEKRIADQKERIDDHDDYIKLEEEKWKKQLQGMGDELQASLDKGRRLSEDVQKYRSRCESYELQIEDLKADVADKDKDIQTLKEDMEHMTEHVQKEIRSIKSTYDDEEKKLREENGRLSMIRAELVSQKEKLEKELEELNAKFQSKTTSFENRLLEARQEWLEKTKEKDDRIQELEQQYVQTKKEMRVLLKAMDARKKESDEKLRKLQQALGDLFHPSRDR